MKNYTITVNGTSYDVVVEESNGTNVAPVKKAVEVAAVAPVKKEMPVAKVEVPSTEGSIKVEAGAAGKVFKIEGSVGQSVKQGDTIVIVEAMKMEIPVVAPSDGKIQSIHVSVGDAIESGALLATLN
ncbi:MAG: biotin/lipoyl-containing protein [Lachnospiraceae bacterium]